MKTAFFRRLRILRRTRTSRALKNTNAYTPRLKKILKAFGLRLPRIYIGFGTGTLFWNGKSRTRNGLSAAKLTLPTTVSTATFLTGDATKPLLSGKANRATKGL